MESNKRSDTVLVVDDEQEWRDYLLGVIGGEYRVIFAGGGDEALRLVSHPGVKVIILDVMMTGGKDGFATFRALNNCPEAKNIPVIMLSSVNQALNLAFDPTLMRQYLGKEPFAFLEKPSTPAQLMKTIQAAIDSVNLRG